MITLDFDTFIGKYYPNASEQRLSDVKRFLTHISELSVDSSLPDKLTDHDFLCNAFYMQRLNSITRTHYQKIKEYLLNLFDWYKIEAKVPTQEEVIEFTQVYAYFRSLESALRFVDHVGELRLANYNSTQDLVIVKSIFILGWYGLSLKEIVALKKVDISKDKNGNGVVHVKDSYITLDSNSFDILMNLKYLDSYKSLPNGTLKILKGCEDYLFRPTTNCNGLTETLLAQFLKRFNDNVPRHLHQNIAFRNIYRNAKFVDVYNDKSTDSLLQKIEKHTSCSPKQAFSYRTQYLAWVELLNQNKI